MEKVKKEWLFLAIFLFLIFCFSFKTPETEWSQDLGRHIKMGQIIWQTKKIPSTNLFSYTHPDFPFINHHWLGGVIFYFVFSLFGNFGLVFLKTILIMLSFTLVILATGQEKSWGALVPFWTLAALIFRERLDVRPEMFGFFFFSLFLYCFQKDKKVQRKWLWFLPFIQALWVNIHLSFVFGLFLTGLWLVSGEVGPRFTRSNLLRKLKIGFFVFLATLFNPHFLKGAFYPFLVFKNLGYSIVENQTIFFLEKMINNPNIFIFKIGVCVGLVSFLLNPQRTIFSLLGFLILSLIGAWQIRHFPFFALFLTFVITQNLSSVLKSYKFFKKMKTVFACAGCVLTLFFSLLYISNFYYKSHDRSSRFGFNPGKIPAEKGADFLLNHVPEAKIFNNFDIGSYLDFKLYPQIQVFADSRPEAYPEEFWEVYKKAHDEEKVWTQLIEKYKIKVVFFSHTDQTPWAENFLKRIVNDLDWQIVYLDETVIVLFKRPLKTPLVISKEDVLGQATNFTDHTQFINLANFCRKVAWFEEEKILLEKALRMEPWSRWANARLTQIYLSSADPVLEYKTKLFRERLKNPIFWF